MIDSMYRNAFKEVYEILENTEVELLEKIPQKFIEFLQTNMNKGYKTSINNNIELSKQSLLPATEDVLALIYRNYWATDEEKLAFSKKDKEDFSKIEENKMNQYKDINEIFEKRKNTDNVILDNSLTIVKKEGFFKKFFNKILKIFKK